jgi:hypothetical protein
MYLGKQTSTPSSTYLISDAEPEDDPSTALVTYAGDVANDHVLILGHSAPAIMCTLIRSGCISATELGRSDRPDAHTADLAIVPDVGALDDAALVIRNAKRALMTAGRIVMCVAAEPSGRLAQGVAALLRQQGFSAIRWRRNGGKTLVSAALPGFGLLTHV